MTEVVFHVLPTTSPKARLHYLIRLLNDPLRQQQVEIRLPDAQAVAWLDAQLWRQPPEGFLPHAPGSEGIDAPVRLWDAAAPESGEVLVNLHPEFFPRFHGYNQLIELLDQSAALLERGRERYRQYRQAGITPVVIKPEETTL